MGMDLLADCCVDAQAAGVVMAAVVEMVGAEAVAELGPAVPVVVFQAGVC